MADTLPFGKDAKPDYRGVEARRPLTKWEFATLMLQQQGNCAKCAARLQRGKVRDEHLHALHLGGGNELTNRQLWCLDCTKPKDKTDKAAIAKGKRIRKETCAGPKKPIPSRGFAKSTEKRQWPSRKFGARQ
jgi:5-methylcytosine-specific restriction endonuclease McrA